MTVIDEVEAMLARHFKSIEALFAKHEQRLREIDEEHGSRNEGRLLQLQLEIDALRG